jgi:hypothetical protein
MFRRPTYQAKGTRARKTSPNGFTDNAQQDTGGEDLVAIRVRREGDKEHLPTPCVVLFAPDRRLPRNEQPVTNEGGLIRFGLGASNDREVRTK